MKLPNGAKAQLGDKLERYCPNMEHPKGKDKAIMFRDRLGITLENRKILVNALLQSAIANEAKTYKTDAYGTHYDIRFSLSTEVGTSLILGCWIVRIDEDFPKLTNAYPVDK